jgi:predicted metal-dependent enzyme (double-stranded beta helix superfamily)
MPQHALNEFVSDVRSLMKSQSAQRAIAECVKPLLERLVSNKELLKPEHRMARKEQFAVYNLVESEDIIVLSAVFMPGQGSPVHDHKVWGAFGILEGQTLDTRYARVDDHSRPGRARLEITGTRTLRQGEVAVSWPPGNDIHKVENPSPDITTVEIHVYGMDLAKLKRNVYNPAADTVSVIQARVPDGRKG